MDTTEIELYRAGRAIRHQNDFACILLIDKRYSSAKISKKLPKWIGEDVKAGDFGAAVRGLAGFFKARRS
jgi:chromosome transmission fidelity protein 1